MDSISFYRPQLPSLDNRARPTALYQTNGLVTVTSQSLRSNRDGFSGGNFQARTFQELNSYWSQRNSNNGSTAMVASRSHSQSCVANLKNAGSSNVAEMSSKMPGSSQENSLIIEDGEVENNNGERGDRDGESMVIKPGDSQEIPILLSDSDNDNDSDGENSENGNDDDTLTITEDHDRPNRSNSGDGDPMVELSQAVSSTPCDTHMDSGSYGSLSWAVQRKIRAANRTTAQRDALVEKFMSLDAATGDDGIADDTDDESIPDYEDIIDYKRSHPSGSVVNLNLARTATEIFETYCTEKPKRDNMATDTEAEMKAASSIDTSATVAHGLLGVTQEDTFGGGGGGGSEDQSKVNMPAYTTHETGSGSPSHSSSHDQSNNSQMEEPEHNTHLSATQTSAGQLGFPQASVDIECIEAEKERVNDVTQAMTTASVTSRWEPTKLDYVRRLPRVQRDQYTLLYGSDLQCKQTTSKGPAPAQTVDLQALSTTTKRCSLLLTGADADTDADADVPSLKRPRRRKVETWKAREAREAREATVCQRRSKRGDSG